jgi:hypothetical protein
MSAISNFLTFLRSAIYAIDVRDGIADAIEQCYNDVNNPTLKTEALEAALQTKIDEGEMAALTIGDGTITAAKLASGVIDNTLATSGAAADAKKTGDEIAAVKADLDNLPTYKELYLAPRIKYALKNVLKNSMFFNQYGGEYLEMLELSLNMSNPTRVNYFTTFSAAYESVYLNNNGTKAWNSGSKNTWRSVPITLGNAKYLEYDAVPSYWRGTAVYVIPAIVFTDDNMNVLQAIEGRDGEVVSFYQNEDTPSAAHHDMRTGGFVKVPFGATKAYVSVEHVVSSNVDKVGTVYLYY